MMYWNGNGHMSGWGWVLMGTSMVLIWAFLIGVAIVAYRAWMSPAKTSVAPEAASRSPEQVLADRFASGEIDETEYRCRLAALHDTGILTSEAASRLLK